MKEKKCKCCNETKKINNFRKTNRGYYISYCNECEKLLKRKLWWKNKNNKYNNYKKALVQDLQGEVWKEVKGYEGLYQVSNFGRVKSLLRFNNYYNAIYKEQKKRIQKERLLNIRKTPRGYLQVCLTANSLSNNKLVHRLVAEAFIPNPLNKPQVNHIDGNKENNKVSNLEWMTSQENNKHAHKIGLNKSHNKRKVNQYDLDWNYIKTWNSITDFLKETNLNLKNSGITSCCKGKQRTAYGYKWKYAKDEV